MARPMLFVSVTVLRPSVERVRVVLCAALLPAVKFSVVEPSVPPPETDSVAVPDAPMAALGVTVTRVAEPVVPVLATDRASEDATGAGGGGGGATDAAVNGEGEPLMTQSGVLLVSCTFFRPAANAVNVKATAVPGDRVPLDGLTMVSAGDVAMVH